MSYCLNPYETLLPSLEGEEIDADDIACGMAVPAKWNHTHHETRTSAYRRNRRLKELRAETDPILKRLGII